MEETSNKKRIILIILITVSVLLLGVGACLFFVFNHHDDEDIDIEEEEKTVHFEKGDTISGQELQDMLLQFPENVYTIEVVDETGLGKMYTKDISTTLKASDLAISPVATYMCRYVINGNEPGHDMLSFIASQPEPSPEPSISQPAEPTEIPNLPPDIQPPVDDPIDITVLDFPLPTIDYDIPSLRESMWDGDFCNVANCYRAYKSIVKYKYQKDISDLVPTDNDGDVLYVDQLGRKYYVIKEEEWNIPLYRPDQFTYVIDEVDYKDYVPKARRYLDYLAHLDDLDLGENDLCNGFRPGYFLVDLPRFVRTGDYTCVWLDPDGTGYIKYHENGVDRFLTPIAWNQTKLYYNTNVIAEIKSVPVTTNFTYTNEKGKVTPVPVVRSGLVVWTEISQETPTTLPEKSIQEYCSFIYSGSYFVDVLKMFDVQDPAMSGIAILESVDISDEKTAEKLRDSFIRVMKDKLLCYASLSPVCARRMNLEILLAERSDKIVFPVFYEHILNIRSYDDFKALFGAYEHSSQNDPYEDVWDISEFLTLTLGDEWDILLSQRLSETPDKEAETLPEPEAQQ